MSELCGAFPVGVLRLVRKAVQDGTGCEPQTWDGKVAELESQTGLHCETLTGTKQNKTLFHPTLGHTMLLCCFEAL